ncbi:MAG: hypothetical protein ACI4VI_07355, partial [Acutalibacteraceae bacterium]
MKKQQFLKRFSACVMVVIMTLTAVPLSGLVGLGLPEWSQMFVTKASAEDTYTEGLFKYTVSDGEATITGHTST